LCILALHKEAKAFDFTIKDTSISEKQNYNAGYLFIRNQEAEQSLIPLLPGYVFGSDALYAEKKVQGVEQLAFHCMLKKYGLSSNTSLQSILGLSDPQIIIKLQRLVHEKFSLQYPIVSQQKEPFLSEKKEETLNQSLKREQEKIDAFLCENASDSDQNILFGIQIESNGKITSIEETEKTNIIDNNAEIQKLVEKEIEEKKLESDLVYLALLHVFFAKHQQYSNEESGVKYSHLVAGATLAGGINQNSFQTALAMIGVTNQCYSESIGINSCDLPGRSSSPLTMQKVKKQNTKQTVDILPTQQNTKTPEPVVDQGD
ncbi:3269_t:CDS:2, partial [Funneliformis geosporum]